MLRIVTSDSIARIVVVLRTATVQELASHAQVFLWESTLPLLEVSQIRVARQLVTLHLAQLDNIFLDARTRVLEPVCLVLLYPQNITGPQMVVSQIRALTLRVRKIVEPTATDKDVVARLLELALHASMTAEMEVIVRIAKICLPELALRVRRTVVVESIEANVVFSTRVRARIAT